jgi:hypothetical protein
VLSIGFVSNIDRPTRQTIAESAMLQKTKMRGLGLNDQIPNVLQLSQKNVI